MTTEEKALAVRAAIGVYARAIEDARRAIEGVTGVEPGISGAVHRIPLDVFAALGVEHEGLIRVEHGLVPLGHIAGLTVFAAPIPTPAVTPQTWRAVIGLADESQAVAQ